ncbi:peroxide stress protein YaaA [Chryseobacterium chendengshani]|uniref:peroxide stress protein YaaA n=1 Tax=Chryseobacterium sp. LJ668 TaxID=2864040 RepID=UPI001C68CA85|nr:peroxide stress protein YaaA [Chryseobacterium sp. LJ668]MBW8522476.1 peroxide stress protein YaaA [Chryseobacterium sp. LJ668]QYK16017.1 peroxide stress protein YaaA [Chryseobacterium sp. LJ668]
MKIITSPAKLMNIENSTDFLRSTTPKFINGAAFIHSFLKNKSPKYLSELMDISTKLADENWERNQKWNSKPKAKESAPALFAFTGEVYRGLDAQSLDKKAVDYLQKNYRILSGLYGLLKPSDKIMLYRLEMGRPFQFDDYKNLYGFWSEKITGQLNDEMKKNEILLNLGSNEYFKVIDRKKLNHKVIDFEFYEIREGKLKTIVVYTKHARGLVVRFCAETQAKTLNDVKAFNYDGYRIDEEKSTDTKLVFTR